MPGLKSRSAAVAEKGQKLSPDEAGDLLAQARKYEKEGDFPNAARLYRQYLSGGGEPLRPDSREQIAKSEKSPAKKSRESDSLASSRGENTTKTASRETTTPPRREPTSMEKQPSLAKKTATPIPDDPWAGGTDKSNNLPVIRPKNSSEKPAPVAKKPTPKATPVQSADAGIPDWARHDGTVAKKTAERKLTQEEINDLMDLDEGEIDWGDEPLVAEESLKSEASETELPVVDFKPGRSTSSSKDEHLEIPEFEEEETSGSQLAKADDGSWESHAESVASEESQSMESDEFSPPVLEDEATDSPESIAMLCKDCEPWVYAQAVKLESADPEARKEALTCLADMGSTARQAGLAVRSMLGDSDPLVQAHAAWALWEIENEPVECVTTLTELLDHPNTEVVQLACYMLGDIGPQADTGRHPLELLRDHAEGSTRIHAAEALIRISGVDKSSLSVLTQAMKSKDAEERWIAAVALGRCRGDGSRDAVKILVSALKDIDPEVRSAAALSLGGLGPDAIEATPDLERIVRNDDPQVRDAALAALACLKK